MKRRKLVIERYLLVGCIRTVSYWCPTRTRRRHGRIRTRHTLKRVKKGHSRTLLWPESETEEKKPIYKNRTLVNR
uniref:Uncharacterized protein n=1 Tax=Gossypium raimondii TaxID=29730 RepID=A0A0D2UJI0_GOSRA|nr:hypothetical protein B456_011G047000 [Gossypium raimondii]